MMAKARLSKRKPRKLCVTTSSYENMYAEQFRDPLPAHYETSFDVSLLKEAKNLLELQVFDCGFIAIIFKIQKVETFNLTGKGGEPNVISIDVKGPIGVYSNITDTFKLYFFKEKQRNLRVQQMNFYRLKEKFFHESLIFKKRFFLKSICSSDKLSESLDEGVVTIVKSPQNNHEKYFYVDISLVEIEKGKCIMDNLPKPLDGVIDFLRKQPEIAKVSCLS